MNGNGLDHYAQRSADQGLNNNSDPTIIEIVNVNVQKLFQQDSLVVKSLIQGDDNAMLTTGWFGP